MTDEEKKEIENFDEMTCYFFIDMIGGIIWRTNHDAGHGRYEITPSMQKDLEAMSEKQVYCVSLLGKFGVDPESTNDRTNGNYWTWFRHWDSWKNAMSNDEWNTLDRLMSDKQDVSAYLPKTKWNDVKET